MAVTKSNPRALTKFSRPVILRPMRAVRLTRCDALDRWVATTEFKSDLVSIFPPTPDDQIMCELFVAVIEVY